MVLLVIDTQKLITNENLYNLGHMTINFSPDLDLMPGSILVSPCVVPDIKQGDIIEF